MTSRTITTDATGRREATPELATVEVTVRGGGQSAADARATVRDRAARVTELLASVSTDRIRTADVQVEDTDELFDPATSSQYEAMERLCVDCDPTAVDTVVEAVADAGETVRTVQFKLRERVHRQLRDEALADAVERARERAERIASVEGATVGAVQDVTTTEVGTGMDSIVDEALAASSDVDVHPEPISVTEGVEAVYRLVEE